MSDKDILAFYKYNRFTSVTWLSQAAAIKNTKSDAISSFVYIYGARVTAQDPSNDYGLI